MATEVADLLIKVRADGAAAASSQLAIVGHEVESAGEDADQAAFAWRLLEDAFGQAGRQAILAAAGVAAIGASADRSADDVRQLNRALLESALFRGGGISGGPPGKGFATDLGSAFRGASNLVQGFLGFLTLVAPTINIIIAALVGVISLLGSAVIAAAAFTAALTATAAVMGLAAFKWRDLLMEGNAGAETFRGAMLAIEAEAFNMSKNVVKSFTDVASGGEDLWTTIAEAGVKGLRAMQPFIEKIVGWVHNFIDALNGVSGASSPFLDFLRDWIGEWKVLASIVNQGVSGSGGILGFFKKYEKPAKAFVEGIAQVINGIRKMSAEGLGLNMDQLAELIRNVFTWLQQIVQIFPRFSNALVTVALELSRFLNTMLPITEAAINLGAALLQHVVAPLLNGVLKAFQAVMDVPIIGWIASLVGGLAVLSFALAKMSLNQVKFTQIIGFLGKEFVLLADRIGIATAAMFGASFASSKVLSVLAGGTIILGVIGAAFLTFRGALNETSEMAKHTADVFDASLAQMQAGAKTGTQVLADTYLAAAEGFNKLSNLGKVVFGIQHFGDAIRGVSPTTILLRESVDKLRLAYDDLRASLAHDVISGSFTDADKIALDQMRVNYEKWKAIVGENPLALISDQEHGIFPSDTAAADFQQISISAGAYVETLRNVTQAHKDGIINAGQFASEMEALGTAVDSTGKKVDIARLKIRGVSLTIVQALSQVKDQAHVATGGLEAFAIASGQSFVDLKKTALESLNDIQGGLLGSGTKVTEFFQSQQDVIDEWKTNMADSVNFVKAAWSTLGDQAHVTAGQIVSALDDAVNAMMDLQHNFNIVKDSLSKQALGQILTLSGEQQATIFAGLAHATDEQFHHINKRVKQGVDLGVVYADGAASAIDLTMRSLVTAIELMMSRTLGISFRKVQAMVDKRVNGINDSTKKLKDRKVNISLEVLTGKGGKTGPSEGPAGLPKPDLDAIKDQYAALGVAATEGFATGFQTGTPKLQTAADKVGKDSVAATAKAIGAHSPATEFVKLGADAIDGLILGLSARSVKLFNVAYALGRDLVAGLKAGVNDNMNQLLVLVAAKIADLVALFAQGLEINSPSKVTYRVGESIMEGLTLGMQHGFKKTRAALKAMVPGLRGDFGKLGNVSMGGSAILLHGRSDNKPQRIKGRLTFDWRRGSADLVSAVNWEDRNRR